MIAVLAALAILAVFISPFTLGPPAAKQKRAPVAMLLAWTAALLALIFARAWANLAPGGSQLEFAPSVPDRLSLICSRLC